MSSCAVRVRVSQGVPGPPGADGDGSGSSISIQTDSDLIPGSAVYVTNTTRLELAAATGLPAAKMVAIATTATLTGFAADAQTQDVLTLTAGQWDAVTGDVGGLLAGETYYLGITPGSITTTAPVLPGSAYNTRVGVALTDTMLDIKIRAPMKL